MNLWEVFQTRRSPAAFRDEPEDNRAKKLVLVLSPQ
ncbi:hypothetical protein L323_03400 [Ruminiclostridium papyrosolvens C7]|uniref:Uncharacterized protein n=1 Tax=Ruminiclostridium papyrosolvens C7 TaxID=1330534 RepID=U4R5E3_9FIRM|nr:hypothetical protein L323_03400 [Ruminiclostridium papyrosolvens C7]